MRYQGGGSPSNVRCLGVLICSFLDQVRAQHEKSPETLHPIWVPSFPACALATEPLLQASAASPEFSLHPPCTKSTPSPSGSRLFPQGLRGRKPQMLAHHVPWASWSSVFYPVALYVCRCQQHAVFHPHRMVAPQKLEQPFFLPWTRIISIGLLKKFIAHFVKWWPQSLTMQF